MGEAKWEVVTTYAAGFEADMAIEQLKSAGILAVRRENDIAGLFGPGFQGASARGVSVLVPWNVVADASDILGVAPRPDADHVLRAHWENPANWNRDGSYRSAEDPRLIVPKRGGGGWTLNVEHRRAQLMMWGFVVAVVLFVTAIGFYATR